MGMQTWVNPAQPWGMHMYTLHGIHGHTHVCASSKFKEFENTRCCLPMHINRLDIDSLAANPAEASAAAAAEHVSLLPVHLPCSPLQVRTAAVARLAVRGPAPRAAFPALPSGTARPVQA